MSSVPPLTGGQTGPHYALDMTRVPYFALLIAAGALLAGCVATPAAAPVPSAEMGAPRVDQATSPTAEPRAPLPDALVIGPEGLEVIDAGGESLFSASYRDPLDQVIAGLESVLGAAPVEGIDPGHIERMPYDTYTWDGLRLGAAPAPDVAFDVRATGDATGGVEVRTPEGVTIGAEAEFVRSVYPGTYESYTLFDIARGPAAVVDETTSPPRTFSITVYLDAPATVVTSIRGPADSHGV
jgi:hypothetical protein